MIKLKAHLDLAAIQIDLASCVIRLAYYISKNKDCVNCRNPKEGEITREQKIYHIAKLYAYSYVLNKMGLLQFAMVVNYRSVVEPVGFKIIYPSLVLQNETDGYIFVHAMDKKLLKEALKEIQDNKESGPQFYKDIKSTIFENKPLSSKYVPTDQAKKPSASVLRGHKHPGEGVRLRQGGRAKVAK